MRNLFLYILLILLPLINSCDKEAVIGEKDYPYIITNEISDITNSSVVFNGDIISTGNTEIVEYGFLWDTDEPKIETANKAIINNYAKVGDYSTRIDSNLFKGSEQIVRSYLKTNNLIVYGNQIKFTCNGGVPATISEMHPLKGYVNSKVVIIGKNFTNQKDNVSVFFGDIEAEIDSCSNNRIVVKVPDIDIDIEDYIIITVYNKTVKSDDKFRAFTYWDKIQDFPGKGRYGAVGFSIDGKGYVGLGKEYDGEYFNDFYEFNPIDNSWKRLKDFSSGNLAKAAGFSIGQKGYVGWGWKGYHDNNEDLWMYTPEIDSWEKILTYDLSSEIGSGYFVIDKSAYLVSNYDFIEFDSELNKINDLGYRMRRSNSVGCSVLGKGYLFAGQGSGNSFNKDILEYYSGEWTVKSAIPSGYREGAVAFSLNDKMYCGMGGSWGSGKYLDFYCFNPVTNELEKLEDFPGAERIYAVSFVIGDKAYVGTGNDFQRHYKDFYVFNPNKE